MEDIVRNKIEGKMKAISEVLDVEFLLVKDESTQRIEPNFDVNAMLSKFVALMVYCGFSVPSTIAPAYNRVNADIDYWKRHFDEVRLIAASSPTEDHAKEPEKTSETEDTPPAPGAQA